MSGKKRKTFLSNSEEASTVAYDCMEDQCGLSPVECQTLPILVNPPSLHWTAVPLFAEIHGRMGYFPPVVLLRSVDKGLTKQYEVAEVINLQRVRDAARRKRR